MRQRPSFPIFAVLVALSGAPALAQTPAPAAAAPATAAPADPVVGRVNGQDILLSDIKDSVQSLPEEYRGMPMQVLFPLLLDQAIDHKAILALADKQGLDKDPEVKRQILRAQEQAIQNALIARSVGPLVSEAAIHARYDSNIAGKPGEEEVHARHILVADEATATKIITEIKAGGDFAAIAKAQSSDPGAAQGGDLGFFKKSDMLPEFADAAWSLKPGEISAKPVKTQYGWHVIKVEERRAAPAPTFEASHDELRQKMIQEGVEKVLADARSGVKIERFNPDGSAIRATDAAEPPPTPAKK